MALSIPYRVASAIDNKILSIVHYQPMTDAQALLVDLRTKGWTNAAIADEIGVTVNAVEKWQSGGRNITPSHLILLNQLTKRKRIPPGKRYQKGSRNKVGKDG